MGQNENEQKNKKNVYSFAKYMSSIRQFEANITTKIKWDH